ncbi:hypothetical protein GCM10022256_28000 [Frondihabitans peucedani]|uniref:Uncharacterized protein n=1 Tax=Frondihabitans peucedani TaxID=598626 RepID=A0ABP8E4L9_9MICO
MLAQRADRQRLVLEQEAERRHLRVADAGVGLLLAESPGETEHPLAYIGSKLSVGDGAADGWSGVSGVCHRSLA